MTPTQRVILGGLQSLGQDADTVAQTLGELGIKGYRRGAEACPISNFVRAQVPPSQRPEEPRHAVMSGRGYSVVRVKDRHKPLEIEHPAAIVNFIRKFDDELYPELVQEPV